MSAQSFIGVPALADELGISKWTVYRLKDKENWPTHPVGRSIRFSPEDVEKIKTLRVAPEPAAAELVAVESKPELTPKQKAAAIRRLGLHGSQTARAA